MVGKSISFYLSDDEARNLETIKKAYNMRSNSETVRSLINAEYHELEKYSMLNLSDKQIIKHRHSNRKRIYKLVERG